MSPAPPILIFEIFFTRIFSIRISYEYHQKFYRNLGILKPVIRRKYALNIRVKKIAKIRMGRAGDMYLRIVLPAYFTVLLKSFFSIVFFSHVRLENYTENLEKCPRGRIASI